MDKKSANFKKLVYDLMNGSLVLEKYPAVELQMVKNEFAEDTFCGKRYKEVFNANRRICQKLNVEEDRDIETIITSLLEIGEYQCMKMYDYGKLFSKEDQ